MRYRWCMQNTVRALGVCGVVASVAILSNCGSEDSNGSGNGASSSGSSGSFGTSGNGGGDGGRGSSNGGPTGNCSGPVDMYVMLDRSNSMADPAGGSGDCDVGGTV